ncbi:hypothetical protein BJ165DRAFT_1496831 [Panaeolus papilionaceus]|nr:hypothetical protein BJ165DRAFT_1496831 [Panaeolus papilionaceus]
MPGLLNLETLSKHLRYECMVVDEWARIYGSSWWKKGTQRLSLSRRALQHLQRTMARRNTTSPKPDPRDSDDPSSQSICRLCSSNDPPNEGEETDWILAAIQERESELSIHTQYLQQRRVLSDVVGNRRSRIPEIAQLEQQISNLKSLVSPLRRLPPELLQEIFLIGAAQQNINKFIFFDVVHGEPVSSWAVAGVCRKWRNVALSTPELWNVLPHLTFERVNFHAHKLQYSKFEFLLRYSGNLPLHLYIEARTPWLPETCPVLDLLIQHSERWETVVVKMTSSTFARLNGVRNRIPRLQRLSLTLWHSWAHNSDVDWDMFAIAPRLTDVSFKCRSEVALRLPESQLTRYSLESMHVDGIGHALQSSSTIQALYIRNERMDPLHDTITLPNLTKLFFQFRHYHSSPSLLDSLSLPALQELVVCGDHPNILATSLSLLRRAGEASPSRKSALKSLRISASTANLVMSNSTTLLSILELVTELQFLDIPLPSIDVLSRLSKLDQEQVIVPLLGCCKFQVVSPISSEICSALNELGATRCKPLPSIVSDEVESTPVQPLSCLVLEHWSTHDSQEFLEQTHYDLEVSGVDGSSQLPPSSAPVQAPSTSTSPFNFRGRRSSHTKLNRAATSNELWTLITEVLPERERGDVPVCDQSGHRLHISRRQAMMLGERLGEYRLDGGVEVQDVMMMKRLYSKLKLLNGRLQCTPAKFKSRYPYLGELEGVIRGTLHAWQGIVDQHASMLRWVHDSTALFYRSQVDCPSRRLSIDSCSSFEGSLAQEYRAKLEEMCNKIGSM